MSTTITHKQVVLDGNYRTTVLQLEAIASALPAFTVLGKKSSDGEITAKATAGTNTGDGALTLDATKPILANVMIGDYRVEVTRAYTDTPSATQGAYAVYDPTGNHIGDGTIGDTWNTQIKFVLAEGNDKFVVGDSFTVEVEQALGTGDLAAWNPAAKDGSEVPYALLAEDAEVAEDEQFVSVYLSGRFNADEIVVPEGYTAENVFDGLREKGILLVHQADIARNPAAE